MKFQNFEIKSDLWNPRLAFSHESKIMLVSYTPKKNKNVSLLSSTHTGKKCILPKQSNKLELIIGYDFGKKVLIKLTRILRNSRRKTVCWPLLIFYNMLYVAAFNGHFVKMDGFVTQGRFTQRSWLHLVLLSAIKTIQDFSPCDQRSSHGFIPL